MGTVRVESSWWPLVWTTVPRAGISRATVFDLVELRSAVDVLRIVAGREPVAWVDPALRPHQTPIRAVHFTQLREATADLWRVGELGPLPDFTAGPVVAQTRKIHLSDLLDLRGWVETYEARRLDLAARIARVYAGPAAAAPFEVWDAVGSARLAADGGGHAALIRTVDGVPYRVPNSGVWWAKWASQPLPAAGTGGAPPARPATDADQPPDDAVRRDGLGRPILLGDPASPRVRIAYGGDGRVAKVVDGDLVKHYVGQSDEQVFEGAPAERVRAAVPPPPRFVPAPGRHSLPVPWLLG